MTAGSDPLMAIAWRDFILFAAGDADICRRFTAETGHVFAAARSPIEIMIDEATGHTADTAREFMLWATEALWGTEGVPAEVLEQITAKHKTPA